MAEILLLYSTVDGQTQKICARVQERLESAGLSVTTRAIPQIEEIELQRFDKVVIGASIRYGRHAKAVYRFIAQHQRFLDIHPCAFFSVNVVARKPGKDQPQTNPYLKRFLGQIAWQPQLLDVFAGKIDYQRYPWYDRWMIRLIMWITQGPTEPDACVEFTDWSRVDAFAQRLIEL